MEKIKAIWTWIVANKKVVIPIVLILAFLGFGAVSYMAGCTKGMSCQKAEEKK